MTGKQLLCDSGVLSAEEQQIASFIALATSDYTGAQFGIDAKDGLFEPSTIVGGMLAYRNGDFVLNVNCRYNTALTAQEIANRIAFTAKSYGFEAKNVSNSPAFYLNAQTPCIKELCAVYAEVSGDEETKPMLLSGGTYARRMENAICFGATFPKAKKPDWAGNGHMKNEAYDMNYAWKSCEIFIKSLIKLQDMRL